MPKRKADEFVNRAFIQVTMSAANTLTFQQVRFAVGTFTGMALLLHQVRYHLTVASIDELAAATDNYYVGVSLRDDLTDINPTNQSIVDIEFQVGIGTNVEPISMPVVHDFSHLPGGGLLIPANPLYVFMNTAGAAAASGCNIVFFYTFVHLSDRESIELLQTIIPGNV